MSWLSYEEFCSNVNTAWLKLAFLKMLRVNYTEGDWSWTEIFWSAYSHWVQKLISWSADSMEKSVFILVTLVMFLSHVERQAFSFSTNFESLSNMSKSSAVAYYPAFAFSSKIYWISSRTINFTSYEADSFVKLMNLTLNWDNKSWISSIVQSFYCWLDSCFLFLNELKNGMNA